MLIPDAIGPLTYLVNLNAGLTFSFDGQLSGDTGLAGMGDEITVFDTSGAVRRKLTGPGSIGLQPLAGATAYAVGRLGAFIDGTWFLDSNGDGAFVPSTESLGWGVPGSVPVAGG